MNMFGRNGKDQLYILIDYTRTFLEGRASIEKYLHYKTLTFVMRVK